jgi:LmbE family N-acetylglucosaminyl deacetylase
MKKIIFGIFAHPDDEAFGPAGTLLKLKSEGYDIHLILLTDGEAGTNPDNVPDLGAVRLKEWQTAANILGATSTHALHYPDGGLKKMSEIESVKLDASVSAIISNILNGYDEETEVSFMSFEPKGLTGHHDHIEASRLTTRMARNHNPDHLWFFCFDSSQAPLEADYYEPHARNDAYITTKVDVSMWLTDKHRMTDAHVSQRADAISAKQRPNITIECFNVQSPKG